MVPYKFLLVLLLFLQLGSCRQPANHTEELSVKAEITGIGRSTECYNHERDHNLFVRLELTNRTNANLSIWIMQCSWMDNWTIDSKDIDFCYPACNSNYPVDMQLKPQESLVFYSVIRPLIPLDSLSRFKIGFFKEDNMVERRAKKLPKEGKTYWSNEITMDFQNNTYIIRK